jgi:hypothetical protein
MKRIITISLIISLLIFTGCVPGVDKEDSTASVSEEIVSIENIEETEENDEGVSFLESWWVVTAKIDHLEEIGNDLGLLGMYMNYIFDVKMAKGEDFSENPDVTGYVGLEVSSTVTFNSDESADLLASEELGGDVSGLGLGVRSELSGFYSNYETEYIQHIGKNWAGTIKNSKGEIVTPPKEGYLLFSDFVMEYEGEGGQIFYGSYDGSIDVNVQLFVFIEPDDIDSEEGAPRLVSVFLNMQGMGTGGSDQWLEGKGQIFLYEHETPFLP